MSIQILQDVKLNGALVFTDATADFPQNPEIGTMVLKDTALYAYIKLGGMETWYPFANRTNSYIHTQGLPSTTWVINHGLGTTDVWTQIKDSNGYIVSATVEAINADTVEIRFTSAVQGTAVVVAPDSINVPEIKAELITVGANVEINTNGVLINGSYALTSANIDTQINNAVAVETTARQAADATLQAAIDTETTARIAADAALQSSITSNFNFEVTARQAADATLTANLAAEVTRATNAENSLQQSINSNVSNIMSQMTQYQGRFEKGQIFGYAPLDESAKVPSQHLPSYVDDVVDYQTITFFPETGEGGKIYVAADTNKTYRWSGSTYVEISASQVDSVNGEIGHVVISADSLGITSILNDKQNILIPGQTIKNINNESLLGPGDIFINKTTLGIDAVDNTADVDKPISTATQTALDGKQAKLVSGSNIKTINGSSVLGSGDIAITSSWSSITGKPTTLSGYGITDAAPSSHTTDFSLHLTSAQNTWIDAITASSTEVNYLVGVSSGVQSQINGKQATLVSGTNIKTINGTSILGSGDVTIASAASVSVSDDTSTNSTFYPLFGASTSGTVSAINVSSTKFSFNPSTGQLNATVFNATSDANAKTDIKPIENALETVKQIQGVSFAWKDTGAKSYGYIAQEIEKVVPEVVSTDEQGRKSVNYDATIAILLEAVKTLSAKIEALEAK